ncbi:MAG: PIN domain-containing protein [Treponema sp.]|nr:PIN domain-containing protein [Treponema sp.]
MIKSILIDAGPLIALFDKDDRYHKKINEYLKKNRLKLVSTIAVITEVLHMLDFSVAAQIDFLEWISQEGIIIHNIQQKEITRIIELSKKYQDVPMDFADATLVVAAEQTGLREIITIDSDFNIYRLFRKEKIENVFIDPY